MTRSQSIQIASRSQWTINRENNEALFRKARRHSRIVRLLRIALPTLVVLMGATITIKTYLSPLLSPLPANLGRLVVSGSKITMDRPHMAGFTRNDRPYDFAADTATQDLTKPNLIDLHHLKAKIQMQDKSVMKLTAPTGLYDTAGQTLTLEHNIFVESTNGFQGRLQDAKVNVKKGQAISNHPVEMKMLQGTLNANRFEVVNSGDLIRFDHGVRMTLMLHENELAKPHAKKTAIVPKSAAQPDPSPAISAAQTTSEATPIVVIRLPEADPRRIELANSRAKKKS